MAVKEKVYALHDFDAENPDEVSFKAGETIIVVEKDDAYGDGWWQGTNPRGETGLFPFSYTTFDRDQAINLDESIVGPDPAILAGGTADASREANGKGVKATMDDIDNALARMQAGRDDASERTGDLSVGETEEGMDAEDDYEKRAKARAALAVNAAKNQEEAEEAERVEQARLKAQAVRIFEEEEERHRQLLLQKEEERKQAAAKGALPTEEKAKEAPIPGVDMSDESDSEGSQGPEYDDLAPTHAPLFGTSSAPTTTTAAAAMGAGALAAGAAAGSFAAGKAGASSNDSALTPSDPSKGQARPLSPIESEGAHAKRSAGGISPTSVPLPASSTTTNNTSTQNGIFQQQQQIHQDRQISDDRSLDSSRVPDSPAPGKSNFTAPSVGTAPTSFVGTETPKSSNQFANTAQQSPAPSTAGSKLAIGPGGDPHEWTVDQVVEWGRSKGWDEASVVSKFAEHEISGDVLMEMDVNILKEIEISAFGKRFQVANAIKDLKKSLATGGAEQSPMQWSAPVDSTSGLLQQQQNRSVSQPIERPNSGAGFSNTNDSGLGAAITGLGVAGGAAAVAGASQQRTVSQSTAPGSLNDTSLNQSGMQSEKTEMSRPNSGAVEPGSASHDSLGNSANSQFNKTSFSPDNSINYSNFNQQHASSPRKRESGGSSTKSPADRTSFFAGLGSQKNRKPAPRVQSGGNSSGSVPNSADAESAGKGTLSRFGLNRLKGGQHHVANEPSPNQDLRNKISLPTGSPTYDAMGDTARRHRLSQFGPATASIPGFSSNHQKQASVGSTGPAAGDTYPQGGEPRSPVGEAPEGAVMVRIRPVEFEGWMRKKGERYNSWKPRYMALKGSDLVLLRDPTAPKIKGYVNMKGYKVIADENTNPGKYGFKILHESEKPHYFSSDDPIIVREWMKALMKATIGRDTSLPVISSYNNATISLKEAQRMNPPPRPPSPTSRARAQRAAARANKDQLTAKDASVLMVSH